MDWLDEVVETIFIKYDEENTNINTDTGQDQDQDMSYNDNKELSISHTNAHHPLLFTRFANECLIATQTYAELILSTHI